MASQAPAQPSNFPAATTPRTAAPSRFNYTVFADNPVTAEAFAPEIEQERAQQQQDQVNAAADAQEKTRQFAAQAQQSGMRTTRDENGNLVPLADPETGKTLYHPYTGSVQYNPDGSPYQITRDQFGNVQNVNPDANAPVGPNTDDPSDPQLYKQNKYTGWQPIGHVDDLAGDKTQPDDVRKTAQQWQQQRGKLIAQAGVQAAQKQATDLQAQHMGAQNQVDTIQNPTPQFDQAGKPVNLAAIKQQLDAIDANPASQPSGGAQFLHPTTWFESAQPADPNLAAQRTTLEKQQLDLQRQLKTVQANIPVLKKQAAAANADAEITRHGLDLSNYSTLADQRLALLKTEGKSPNNDPVLAAIQKKTADLNVKLGAARDAKAAIGPPDTTSGSPPLGPGVPQPGTPLGSAPPSQSPVSPPGLADQPAVAPQTAPGISPQQAAPLPAHPSDQSPVTTSPVPAQPPSTQPTPTPPAGQAPTVPATGPGSKGWDATNPVDQTLRGVNASILGAPFRVQGAVASASASVMSAASRDTQQRISFLQDQIAKQTEAIKQADAATAHNTELGLPAPPDDPLRAELADMQQRLSDLKSAPADTPQDQQVYERNSDIAEGLRQVAREKAAIQPKINAQVGTGDSAYSHAGESLGKIPDMLIPYVGVPMAVLEAGADARQAGEQEAKTQGKGAAEISQAGDTAANRAVIMQAPTLLAYGVNGKIVGNLVEGALEKMPVSSPWIRGLMRGTGEAAANVATSTGMRATEQASSPTPDWSQVWPSWQNSVSDLAFGLKGGIHSGMSDAATLGQINKNTATANKMAGWLANVRPDDLALPNASPGIDNASVAKGFAARNPDAPAIDPTVVAKARDFTPPGDETAIPQALTAADRDIEQREQALADVHPGNYAGRLQAQQDLFAAYQAKTQIIQQHDARLLAVQQISAIPDWQPPVDPQTGQPTEPPDPARDRETAGALLKVANGFDTDDLTAAEQARLKASKDSPAMVRQQPDGSTILTDAGRQALAQSAPAATPFVSTTEAQDLRTAQQPDEPATSPQAPETTSPPKTGSEPASPPSPASDDLAGRIFDTLQKQVKSTGQDLTPEREQTARQLSSTAATNLTTALQKYQRAFHSVGMDVVEDKSEGSAGVHSPGANEIRISLGDIIHPDNLRGLQDPQRAERAIQEEAIHAVAQRLEHLGQIDPVAVWNSVPPVLQNRVRAVYGDESNPRNLGHEVLRQIVQGRLNMTDKGWADADGKLLTEQTDPGLMAKARQSVFKLLKFFKDLHGSILRAGGKPEDARLISDTVSRLEKTVRGVIDPANRQTDAVRRENAPDQPAPDSSRAKGAGDLQPAQDGSRDRAVAAPVGHDLADGNVAATGQRLPTDEERARAAAGLNVDPSQIGHVSEVTSSAGQRVRTAFVVREAADARPSHTPEGTATPGYPQDFQPRDRSGVAYRRQAQNIAGDLDLDRLADSPRPDEGSPIVTASGHTLTGNGRDIALGLGYRDKFPAAAKYKARLFQRAPEFGISRRTVAGMKQPVLHRVILGHESPDSLRRFSEDSNASPAMASNALETAGQDARRLTPALLSLFDPNYNLESAKNADFLKAFGQQVILGRTKPGEGGANELNLSPADLGRRARLAMFAAAYGGDNASRAALERMGGDTEDNGRNISQSLLTLAPVMARLRVDTATGDVHPNYDISAPLVRAAQEISEAIANRPPKQSAGAAVDGLLAQQTFDTNPLERAALGFFARNRTNRGTLEEGLSNYAESVYGLGNPKHGADMFGDRQLPTPLQLFMRAASPTNAAERAGLRSRAAEALHQTLLARPTDPAGEPADVDPRIAEAFGKDWAPGYDKMGLPNFPRTVEDLGHPDWTKPTMEEGRPETLPATADIDSQSKLAKLYPGLAGKTIPRKLLHNLLLNHFLKSANDAELGAQKVAWLSGGGGGAGKSTILKKMEQDGEYSKRGLVSINADDFKEFLPEYERLVQAGDSRATNVSHEESSYLAKELQRRAIEAGHNMVFDATLANKEKSLALIRRLKEHGYRVKLAAVTVDPHEALIRAMTRAKNSGRYVPVSELLKAHKGFNDSLPDYLQAVDEAKVYDNTPPMPREVPIDHIQSGAYATLRNRARLDENATTKQQLQDSYLGKGDQDQAGYAGADGRGAESGGGRGSSQADTAQGVHPLPQSRPAVSGDSLLARRSAPDPDQPDFFSGIGADSEAKAYAASLPAHAKVNRPSLDREASKDIPELKDNDAALGNLFAHAHRSLTGSDLGDSAPPSSRSETSQPSKPDGARKLDPVSAIPANGRLQSTTRGDGYREVQGGNATVAGPATFTLKALAAYHGTPHEVGRFSSERIGTGEGAQVYGHGLYFAENRATAEAYKNTFQRQVEGGIGAKSIAARLLASGATPEQAVKELRSRAAAVPNDSEFQRRMSAAIQEVERGSARAHLYQVHLDANPDELLDWDKPLSEQSEKVKSVLAERVEQLKGRGEIMSPAWIRDYENGALSGEQVYRGLGLGNARSASAAWHAAGIPGIRYLDEGSRYKHWSEDAESQLQEARAAGDQQRVKELEASKEESNAKTSNYVMFDDSRIRITHKNGQPVDDTLRSKPSLLSVDENGIHDLAKPRGTAYLSDDEQQRDPAHILASIVRGGDDATPRQPWKPGRGIASHSEALAQSARAGRLIDPAQFEAALSSGTPQDGGGEHAVTYDPASDRFLKLTKPGLYGAQGDDAGAYLQRWALHNRVFGDDVKFEGHVHLSGEDDARAVISQPRVTGHDSTPEEQADFLQGKGFHEQPDGSFINPVTGVKASDTITPGNAITTPEGEVRPIDLQTAPATPAELRQARAESGIGEQSVFARTSEQPATHPVDDLLKLLDSGTGEKLDKLTDRAVAETPGQRTIGRPELANGALDPRTMAVDEVTKTIKPETHEEWERRGQEILARDEPAFRQKVLDTALMGGVLDDPGEIKAANVLLGREAGKPDSPEQRRMLQSLAFATRLIVRKTAQVLGARKDPNMTPTERARGFLMSRVAKPPDNVLRQLDVAKTQAERKAILDADHDRMSRAWTELAKTGITYDDIFHGEVQLRLKGAKIIDNTSAELFDGARQRALKLLQGGARSFADAAKSTGLSEQDVKSAYDQMRNALKDKLRDKVRRGATAENLEKQKSLLARASEPAPALKSDADTEAELNRILNQMGFVDPAKVGRMKVRQPKKQIFRPPPAPADPAQFEAWKRAGVGDDVRKQIPVGQPPLDMRLGAPDPTGTGERTAARFVRPTGDEQGRADFAGETPAAGVGGATGERAGARFIRPAGDEQGRMDIDEHPTMSSIDLSDPVTVARLSRAVEASNANAYDKAFEFWSAGLLSGPQTHVAIGLGNTLNAGFEFTVQRGTEALLNHAFYHDPNSAQAGEMKYILRGLLPGLRNGLSIGLKSFQAEASMFEPTYLDQQMTLDPGEHMNAGFKAAIGGNLGKIVRLPFRAVGFMDGFMKTAIWHMQVGAEAYRLAKQENPNLKGAFLAKRIDELSQPGGEAAIRAVTRAEEMIGQSPYLPDDNAQQTHERTQRVEAAYRQARAEGKTGDDITDRAAELLRAPDTGGWRRLVPPPIEHNPLDVAMAKFQDMARSTKLLSYAFPYLRMPYNLMKMGLRKSPLGVTNIAARLINSGLYKMKEGRPMFESYPAALQTRHLAEQALAWTAAAALYSAVEGDGEDDKKKHFLITGSRSFMADKQGQRDLLERTAGGATTMRIGNTTFNYGRYEPTATVLSTLADGVRTIKAMHNGATKTDAIDKFVGYVTDQVSSKSMLQGMSDLQKDISGGGGTADRAKRAMMTALVPNIIRQPLRNLDDYVRDTHGAPTPYSFFPTGGFAEKKLTPYGQPVEKTSNPISRILFPAATKPMEHLNNADRLLMNWNEKHPGEQWAPEPLSRKRPDPKTGKETEMSNEEYAALQRRAALKLNVKLSSVVNSSNASHPTADDVHELKKAFESAHAEAKKEAFGSKKDPIPEAPLPKPSPRRGMDIATTMGWDHAGRN